MLQRIAGLIALASCAFLTGPVGAAVSYQYVTDQTTYSANPGASVTVQVFLLETLTSGSQSVINGDNGLFGAGVGLQQTGTVPTNATIISSISTNQSTIGVGGGFGPGSGFDQTNVATNGSNAALVESIAVGTANGPTTDANGKILLGTVTLTAGAAGTTTTFSVTSFAHSSNSLAQTLGEGNTITNHSGFDLDKDSSSPSFSGANDITNTFTVTAVPEPGTLLLCGLAVCGGAFGAYLRRKE